MRPATDPCEATPEERYADALDGRLTCRVGLRFGREVRLVHRRLAYRRPGARYGHGAPTGLYLVLRAGNAVVRLPYA